MRTTRQTELADNRRHSSGYFSAVKQLLSQMPCALRVQAVVPISIPPQSAAAPRVLQSVRDQRPTLVRVAVRLFVEQESESVKHWYSKRRPRSRAPRGAPARL